MFFWKDNVMDLVCYKKWIVFEGINGSGKTTQINAVADRLRAKGDQVVVTSDFMEPLGAEIKKNLFSMDPRSQVFAINFLRSQNMINTILPARENGAWILSDRHVLSTFVYQRISGIELDAMHFCASYGFCPSLTFVIDISPEEAYRRCNGRDGVCPRTLEELAYDREEMKYHAFQNKDYNLYNAPEHTFKYSILTSMIDGMLRKEKILDQIMGNIELFRKIV